MKRKKILTLGHSPDADDAFMFYALAKNKIDTGIYQFEHILLDIETLNNKALNNELDITAISLHNFPYIHENYSILSSGVSMGDNYGPILVCRGDDIPDNINNCTIAIPGKRTTAFLVLQFVIPKPRIVEIPFDKIIDAVVEKKTDLGLIIHEGQRTYPEYGLHKLLDLGEWWKTEFDRPLPLGVNVINNRFSPEEKKDISSILKNSISYSLNHFDDALKYAMQFSGGLSEDDARAFVEMYVNHYTLDYQETGRDAVLFLLEEAAKKALVPKILAPDFV